MKRRLLLSVSALVASAALSFPLAAQAFTEGTDYITLEKPLAGGEGKLVKIWSYACPFCYRFDVGVDPKLVPAIESKTNLKFEPWHLETKGNFGRPASELLAALLLQDEAKGLNVESKDSQFKKAKDAWYTAYHRKNQRWPEGEAAFMKTGLDALGMDEAQANALRADPKAQALTDHWKAGYDIAKIQGVPAYVVNGKYLVMTQAIKSLGSFEELVVMLAKKE